MPRNITKLPSFNAVGANQTATVNLPIGRRYHEILIYYKGNASQAVIEADITMVRVKVDGKVQRAFKPSEINKVLGLNGVAFRAGLLPIYFSEPWRRNVASEDVLAWGTQGLTTFQIEIDIASGATSPTLEAYAVTDNVAAGLSNIIKMRRQVFPVSADGLANLHTLPKRDGEIYQRVHCFEGTAGDVESAEVVVDQETAFDANAAVNKAIMSNRNMIAQTGVFHICFDSTQRIEDGLPMSFVDTKGIKRKVQDLQFNFQMANANDLTLLIEARGNPD